MGEHLKAAVVALCLLISVAQACPTKADLSTGIRVTEVDNVIHDYTRLDASTVRKITIYEAGEEGWTKLHYGAYPVHSIWADDGVVDFTSLLLSLYEDALPTPENGVVWEGGSRVVSGYDGTYDETLSIKWGSTGFPLTEIAIGTCKYMALSGKLVTTNEFETFQQTLAYIPELGLALQYAFRYGDSEPENSAFSRIKAILD